MGETIDEFVGKRDALDNNSSISFLKRVGAYTVIAYIALNLSTCANKVPSDVDVISPGPYQQVKAETIQKAEANEYKGCPCVMPFYFMGLY